jgi:hypothetical protein
MIGVSLSRWTMSYFAAALGALLLAELMMATGYGFPGADLRAPETLVLVHVVAIGWLSLLMCGALFQFLPVLVNRPLASNNLPLPALICLLAGLAALLVGFMQLGGNLGSSPTALPIAGLLLGTGFCLVLWNLARTLLSAPEHPLPARFVVVGLWCLGATATLGIVFTLVFGGATSWAPLLALTGVGLPVHVIAGLGGWLTFTAMGVSYRLLAMFMLSPDLERATSKATLYLGSVALVVGVAGGVLVILAAGNLELVLLAALGSGVVALVLYGADVVQLYRARKRRIIELNSRMAALALASLGASVALLVALAIIGRLTDEIGAVVFLVAFGWLSGLGLSQLYKIVAFLTWLECYGPVLGKAPTPRVQDLVVERRAAKWFLLYFAAVWAGTAALLAGHPSLFKAAAAVMFVGTLGVASQLVRTRRLADVKAPSALPQGAQRPRLLYSLSHQS